MSGDIRGAAEAGTASLHLRFGWWALLVFLTLGVLLEMLHGFKLQWYVSIDNETRRHLWTLAHAHGTLLAVVNIAFALTVRAGFAAPGPLASRLLRGATVLLPGGFFLGGLVFYGGDPGFGVLLVPFGAAMLIAAVFLTARAAGR
jgi:hypothetical protein